MATSNARIQFSTADEETWKSVNPALREGELVIAKKPSGKYRLYVGATGGSKFNDSIVVWDEELADSHEKNAAISADSAMTSKSAAAASASYAAQSMSAAKTSADAAAQSMSAAKTSADAAAQSMNAAKASADAAEQSKTSAALSSNEAAENMRKAEYSANKSETAATNAISSANSASQSETNAINAKNESNKSASNAKISETNAKASEKAAAISAGAVSYATQEEVNDGKEEMKIVSPKTLKGFENNKYLLKSGGTVTGAIERDYPGTYIQGRDRCLVKTPNNSGEFNAILSCKTKNGSWEIGAEPNKDRLILSYTKDSDYAENRNVTSRFYISEDGHVTFPNGAEFWIE